MSIIIGAVGLIFALAGFLSLLGLSDFLLYFVELSQLHHIPPMNAIPSAWLYMLLGFLLLLFAGNPQAMSRTGGEHY